MDLSSSAAPPSLSCLGPELLQLIFKQVHNRIFCAYIVKQEDTRTDSCGSYATLIPSTSFRCDWFVKGSMILPHQLRITPLL